MRHVGAPPRHGKREPRHGGTAEQELVDPFCSLLGGRPTRLARRSEGFGQSVYSGLSLATTYLQQALAAQRCSGSKLGYRWAARVHTVSRVLAGRPAMRRLAIQLAMAVLMRSGVNGSSRMRTPVVLATALAMAAAVGPWADSPVPRKG